MRLNSPLKVIHIITGLSNAGAESVLFSLIKSRGESVHMVVSLSTMGYYGSKLVGMGIEVISLDMPKSKITLSGLCKLYRSIVSFNPDIIQTWLYHANFIGGIIGKILCRKKVIWGIHHASIDDGTLSLSTRLIARLGAFLSFYIPERIVFCSAFAKNSHTPIGYQTSKCVVIENGFDFDKFSINPQWRKSIRKEFDIDNETVLLGMAARWDPSKDYSNLIKALGCFNRFSDRRWCCLLFGQSITFDNKALIKLLKENKVHDKVILAGPRGDVECVMNALDIFVLSSSSESFGNVLVEALACGVPVVSTQVGEVEAIVGNLGWIVPKGNPSALANGLQLAISRINHGNAEWNQRRLLGRERVIMRYGVQRMADQYHHLWSSAY